MKTTIRREVRTDKLNRKVTWYVLADGRAFRSERQAKAAKPTKARKSKLPAPVAAVLTAEQATLFVLTQRTIGNFDYAKAMYCYMAGNRSEQTVRTLGTQWQYAAQAAMMQD